MVEECTVCHGSGWVRTTALHELNRPDTCKNCGGSGLEYHKFSPSDSPNKCDKCAYPVISLVHKSKEER